MQFINAVLFAAAALASLASATNTVEFVNQDSTTRTIYFFNNPGMEAIPELTVPGSKTVNQTFAEGWVGNWYAVSEGKENKPGMLGEVAFNSFAGATYFDVSAIVNPDDNEGVKQLFPKFSSTPVSGCQTFPCANAYNKPDDIQTQSTKDATLVCLLGSNSKSRRHSRDFVTGAATSA